MRVVMASSAGSSSIDANTPPAASRSRSAGIMRAKPNAVMPALFAAGGNIAALYLAVFVVYWCYGTQLSVNGVAASDFWGTKNAGVNYGMLFTAWGVAGIIGPYIGGQLFDKFKNYEAAFKTGAILSAVALGFAFLAKHPSKEGTA